VRKARLQTGPLPGDRIIFERADGQYDVREICAAGEHRSMGDKGLSFEAARDIANDHLERGHRLWVAHHMQPDRFEPFAGPTARRHAPNS
jgi:hypothetical protein